MKTIFLTAYTLLLISGPMMAQQTVDEPTTSREAKKRVVLGLKAGINSSNVYARSGDQFVTDARRSLGGGVFLSLPLGSLLGIQPELLLLQKGFKGTGRMEGQFYSLDRYSTHLDIPLQVMVKPFRWISFLAGPQYSFLLGHKDRFRFDGNSQVMESEFNSDRLNESLVGAVMGFDLNFGHVQLGLRSGWDLSNSNEYVSSSTPRYRNRWLFWTLGYRFY